MRVLPLLLLVLSAAAASAATARVRDPPITGVPPIIDDLVALLMAVVERIYEWIISHLFPGAEIDRTVVLQLRASVLQEATFVLDHLQTALGDVSRQELADILAEANTALQSGKTPSPKLVQALQQILPF